MKRLLSLVCTVTLVLTCVGVPSLSAYALTIDDSYVQDFTDYVGESTFATPPTDSTGRGTWKRAGDYVSGNIGVTNIEYQDETGADNNALDLHLLPLNETGLYPWVSYTLNQLPTKGVVYQFKVLMDTLLSIDIGSNTNYRMQIRNNQNSYNVVKLWNSSIEAKNFDDPIVRNDGEVVAQTKWATIQLSVDAGTGDVTARLYQDGRLRHTVNNNIYNMGYESILQKLDSIRFMAFSGRSTEPREANQYCWLDDVSVYEAGNLAEAKTFDFETGFSESNSDLSKAPMGFKLKGAVGGKAGVIRSGSSVLLKNDETNTGSVELIRGMGYDAYKHKITTSITPKDLTERSIILYNSDNEPYAAVEFKSDGKIYIGDEEKGEYTVGTQYNMDIKVDENIGKTDVEIEDSGTTHTMTGVASLGAAGKDILKFSYMAKGGATGETTIDALSYMPIYPVPLDFVENSDQTATATVAKNDISVIAMPMTLVTNVYNIADNQLVETKFVNFDRTVTEAPKVTVAYNAATQYADAYIIDSLDSFNIETAKVTIGNDEGSSLTSGEVVNTDFSADNSRSDGSVTIKNAGLMSSGATLLLLKPGKTMTDFVADATSAVYIKNFEGAQADGIHFGLDVDESGLYDVYVNKNDGLGMNKVGFLDYVSPTKVSELMIKLNKDDADFKSLILEGENAHYLNIDKTLFESWADDADTAAENYAYAQTYFENAKGEGYNPDSFKATFDLMIATRAYANATTAEEVENLLDTYFTTIRQDLFKVYSTYMNIRDDKKSEVLQAIANETNIFDVEDVFTDYTIFTALKHAGNQLNVSAILENTYELIGIDEESYESYTNLIDKTTVNGALTNKSFDERSQIAYAFKEAVKAQVKAEKEPKKDSNNTSNGSGAGISITKDYTPSASAPVSTPSQKVFVDVEEGHWAKQGIEYLASKGIVNGKGNKIFAPEDAVKREEFVKMIVLAFDEVKFDKSVKFDDVTQDAWYSAYIFTAAEKGIVNGLSDNIFGVGENISRQDVAVMIYRAAKAKGIKFPVGVLSFSDNEDISDYAKESITALCAQGSINGTGDGTFAPLATATRAQVSKILYDVMQKGGINE